MELGAVSASIIVPFIYKPFCLFAFLHQDSMGTLRDMIPCIGASAQSRQFYGFISLHWQRKQALESISSLAHGWAP